MTEQLENALKEITSHLQYYGTLSDEEEALGNLCAAIDTAIRQAIAAEREACAGIAESNIETAKEVLKAADPMLRVQAGQVIQTSKIIAARIRARAEGDSGDKNQ